MPTFADLNTIRVTGTYVMFDGSFGAGTVTFETPGTLLALRDSAGNQIIVPKTITVTLDSVGHIAVDLPATNDTDVTPTGFTYTVTERITGAAHGTNTYNIPLLIENGSTQDLADIAPVAPLDGFSQYALESDFLILKARVDALGSVGGDLSPVFSKAGTIAIGALHGGWPAPTPFTIHQVIALLTTAPLGQSAIFDVQKNGTSIFPTGSRRPTILSGQRIGKSAVLTAPPDVPGVTTDDILTASVIQPGLINTEGSDLTLLVVKG